MNDLDAALDTLAFFRSWKSTFLAAVETSDKGARAADEALARAELLLGRLPEAPPPATPPSQADALAALEAHVALLDAFEAARKRRETWLGWIERATPGGPLAAWRVEADRSRPVLDRLLVEADAAALPDVRAELDKQLAAVDGIIDATRIRLQEARAQVKGAVDTFDQAVRILTEDVRRMEDKLEGLRALAAAAEHEGVGPLVGAGLFAGAAFGMIGWFGGGANAGVWATCAGGGALVVGLGAGLWRWGRTLGDAQGHIAALDRQARELGVDLDGARATVLGELAAAAAAWEAAAQDAAELRFDAGRLDTAPAATRVRDPAVTLPLEGLRARIATLRVSDRSWRAAAGAVGAVGLLVALSVALVLRGPGGEAPVATAPAVAAPGDTTGDRAAAGTPAVEGATIGAGQAAPVGDVAVDATPADGAPAKPAAPAPAIAAGAWTGTMGLATVEGTLTQQGGKLSGSFTLVEAGGAPRTCTAKGSTASGDKVRLTLQGCGSPVRLEGAIRDGGRTLRGKARSTGTGAFAGAEVVDAFELNAG